MKEVKKKCFCRSGPTFCCECESKSYPLDDQEVDDILSAVSYFVDTCKGASITKKAMTKLSKKFWKMRKVSA